MKILSVIIVLFAVCNLSAQQPKGAGAAPTVSAKGNTWALVVGVSDYQDAHIPDLRFADKDAQEFVAYLQSKGGGQLKEERIKILTNEQATYGQIYSALDWLLEVCKPDDQVFVYFSGHGDVEAKTLRQLGFLLAYDTPPNNYRMGGVRLEDLNDYLETIVQINKSKVVLITDACRSGNLAGGREGVLSTATALSAQFQNEIKIMSCQPNELSLEGEQWGGGRGAFSYHLIDGLTGMADLNKDNIVNLFEIDRYLQDNVPTETDQKQFPVTTGNKGALLCKVDAAALAALKEKRSGAVQMSEIAVRGIENEVLAKADTSVQEKYEAFLAAVNDKYFLPSDLNPDRRPGQSASELYELLLKETTLEPLHPYMKRNFAAALQDESQQALNAYLRTEPQEMAARMNQDIDKYKKNPVYMAKAASLLGEGHILYKQLLAKQYYFEGLIKRLEGIKNNDGSLYEEALALEYKALGYDSLAAYIYNEIGLIYDEIRIIKKTAGDYSENKELFQKQMGYYKTAMGLAPKWVMPVLNSAQTNMEWEHFNEAEYMGLATIALDSNLVDPYIILGYVYYRTKQYEKGIEKIKKLLSLYPNKSIEWNYNIACFYALLNQPHEAVLWLEKSIELGIGYEQVQQDPDLESLRKSVVFEELVQKHFPNRRD